MSAPSTALIILGEAMFLKPDDDDDDVVSFTVTTLDGLATCLVSAEPLSLATLHIVVKSKDISRLYDPYALSSFHALLQPGALVHFHVLSEGGTSDDDMETIKLSLIMAELQVETEEEGPDGSKMLTSRKLDKVEVSVDAAVPSEDSTDVAIAS
jgi:hypothetical protein